MKINAQNQAAISLPRGFGRYELLELIAKGGMAEVFKGRLVGPGGAEKHLCIKRILPHLSNNREFVALFIQEAKIALTLTHSNITQVFDFGEVDGLYFLAMEYIEGTDVFNLLERLKQLGRRLDIPSSLFIAAEVAKGLHYAHSAAVPFKQGNRAIVHRDVTPQNILLSINGEVKLTDFGIALVANQAGEQNSQTLRGKAAYLSPEQIKGQVVDRRSDIFSLGAVLYELLTGTSPFAANSDTEILRKIQSETPAPPSKSNKEIIEQLDNAVMCTLAQDAERRYAHAADLEAVLRKILRQNYPDFTAAQLAQTVQELFFWEFAKNRGLTSEDAVRQTLLLQLSRSGMAVNSEHHTADLLNMGTVNLSPVIESKKSRANRKYFIGGLMGTILLILLGAVFIIFFNKSPQKPLTAVDHGEQLINAETTEHLLTVNGQNDSRADKSQLPTTLNLNSWPWSKVTLNGQLLRGNTPLYKIKVSPGKHRLVFQNPELGLAKEITVSVMAGESKTVAISLRQ